MDKLLTVEEAAERLGISVRPVGRLIFERRIAYTKLGLANSKQVTGASFFADVDGFTAYVDEAAESDEDLVEAIQAYHVIRSEMRYVAVEDYGALRIQYAGDRMQAIAFLPIDDEAPVSHTAVEIAAGLHASIKHTLPIVLDDAVRPLAIGQALGAALISRLGEHGQPDVVCIGPATEAAVGYQQALKGWATGISTELRDQLPGGLAAEFKWRAAAGCYVAADLTADRLDRQRESRRLDAGVPALVAGRGRVTPRGAHTRPSLTPAARARFESYAAYLAEVVPLAAVGT